MASSGKLFTKNYILLWQGQFVSKIGSQLYLMAAMMWIVENTGSAKVLAAVGAAGAAVAVLLGPFTGTIADQYSRKRIIVLTDFLNGLVISAFALVTLLHPHNISLIVTLLVIVSIISSTLSSFFAPAIDAAIPDIVPKEKLTAANSMAQLSSQISIIGSATASGFLFQFFGGPILFLFNGISFIFSSVSEMFITIPQRLLKKPETRQEVVREFTHNLADGFKYIWRQKGLKHIVILYALLTFFTQPIIILMSFFIKLYLNVGDNWEIWIGYLSAIFGVGNLGGFFLANLVKAKNNNRAGLLILFTLLESLAYGLFGTLRNPFAALAVAFIAGIFSGFVMVNIMVILQRSTPSEIRGRLFGVLATMSGILAPIAILFSGIIADALNNNIPVIYYFCSISMFVAALIMTSFRDYRYFINSD